jgi:hypothetical protein
VEPRDTSTASERVQDDVECSRVDLARLETRRERSAGFDDREGVPETNVLVEEPAPREGSLHHQGQLEGPHGLAEIVGRAHA